MEDDDCRRRRGPAVASAAALKPCRAGSNAAGSRPHGVRPDRARPVTIDRHALDRTLGPVTNDGGRLPVTLNCGPSMAADRPQPGTRWSFDVGLHGMAGIAHPRLCTAADSIPGLDVRRRHRRHPAVRASPPKWGEEPCAVASRPTTVAGARSHRTAASPSKVQKTSPPASARRARHFASFRDGFRPFVRGATLRPWPRRRPALLCLTSLDARALRVLGTVPHQGYVRSDRRRACAR